MNEPHRCERPGDPATVDRVIGRIDADLTEAGLVPCAGPGCGRFVYPWISPCCGADCHRAARAADLVDGSQVQAVEAAEAGGGLERHRAVLAGAPLSVLHDPDWLPADEPQSLAPCPPHPPEPPLSAQPESIKCPRCGRTSHNPHDVRERYCGACHAYLDQPHISGPPLVDPRGMVQARPPWWRRLRARLARRRG